MLWRLTRNPNMPGFQKCVFLKIALRERKQILVRNLSFIYIVPTLQCCCFNALSSWSPGEALDSPWSRRGAHPIQKWRRGSHIPHIAHKLSDTISLQGLVRLDATSWWVWLLCLIIESSPRTCLPRRGLPVALFQREFWCTCMPVSGSGIAVGFLVNCRRRIYL